jgi:hypothetical protein
MKLALGKFSIENFSRFSKSFTAVEIDLSTYLKWDERDRRRFRAWIQKKQIQVIPKISLRIQRIEEEYLDLISAARDEFADRLLFFLITSGRKRFDLDYERNSLGAFGSAVRGESLPLCFEWGEEDTPLTIKGISGDYPGVPMMLDLDYHWKWSSKVTHPLKFKIHGWHSERWMRRYGETLIAKFKKRMKAFPDSILILAHSGRIEEAPEFR